MYVPIRPGNCGETVFLRVQFLYFLLDYALWQARYAEFRPVISALGIKEFVASLKKCHGKTPALLKITISIGSVILTFKEDYYV